MDVLPIQSRLDAAQIPPERLVGDTQLTEEQKLAEISRQFEAILLRQILQNTQKTIIPSDFSDNSTAASIYQDMVTSQLADSISKSGTLGLAATLQHQLSRQLQPASSAGHGSLPEAQPTSPSGGNAARPDSCPAGDPPHALNRKTTGTPPL